MNTKAKDDDRPTTTTLRPDAEVTYAQAPLLPIGFGTRHRNEARVTCRPAQTPRQQVLQPMEDMLCAALQFPERPGGTTATYHAQRPHGQGPAHCRIGTTASGNAD